MLGSTFHRFPELVWRVPKPTEAQSGLTTYLTITAHSQVSKMRVRQGFADYSVKSCSGDVSAREFLTVDIRTASCLDKYPGQW